MYNKFFKRPLDLILSLLACIPFAFIYLIVAILIKAEDNGPVFYSGERIGKNGEIFKMHKFRSMKVNAPDMRNPDGSTYTSNVDPRVTKIGNLLRKTSLDELPQILNIVKGNMSIIGPRATLADSEFLDDEVDKLKVRPGLTGYNQCYFRNNITQREKRLNDVWYANNISLWLDIKIFFKTIGTVAKRDNLYSNSSAEVDATNKTPAFAETGENQ